MINAPNDKAGEVTSTGSVPYERGPVLGVTIPQLVVFLPEEPKLPSKESAPKLSKSDFNSGSGLPSSVSCHFGTRTPRVALSSALRTRRSNIFDSLSRQTARFRPVLRPRPMHNCHRDQRSHKIGVYLYSPCLCLGVWILRPQRRKFLSAEMWLRPAWISQSPRGARSFFGTHCGLRPLCGCAAIGSRSCSLRRRRSLSGRTPA
jgi:hypothetical protein